MNDDRLQRISAPVVLAPVAQIPHNAAEMTTVAIVCGYDLDSDLAAYVDRVAERLRGRRVDAVILSGGRTSPFIDSSEAYEMNRHLSEVMPHGKVLLDHEAMTTLDNIVHGRTIAEGSFERVEQWLVCCDVAHVAKAWMLARIVLPRRIRMLAVHRRVPLLVWLREPLSIVIESFGALVPRVRPFLSSAAAMMKGVTSKQRRSTRREAA